MRICHPRMCLLNSVGVLALRDRLGYWSIAHRMLRHGHQHNGAVLGGGLL
jgi:hypothetical protein